MSLSYRIDEIWNSAFEEDTSGDKKDKEPKKRDRIWATELDKAPVDVFLKMNGMVPTNPPDPRAKRKFEAGNIWEQIIIAVLGRAGIVKNTQKWCSYKYEGLLEVGGYLDIMAGGEVNFEKAKEIMKNEFGWLPERTKHAFEKVIDNLISNGRAVLPTIIFDVKSTSAFMYDVYKSKGRPSLGHELQLFHYLKAENMREGHILYISRDDARMLEFGVLNPSPLEDIYKERIAYITGYYKANERPPLEEFIEFDEERMRFSTNWRVMYSDYLTLLYGFEHQESFRQTFQKRVNDYNRIFKRMVLDKNMTDKNLEIIEELQKDFPEYERLVEMAKKNGFFEEGGDEDD